MISRLMLSVMLTLMGVFTFSHTTLSDTNFRSDSYDVFYGDVDGDGIDDIYLRAVDKYVLIAIMNNAPILYQDGPSLLLAGNGSGFDDPIEYTQTVDTSSLSPDTHSVLIGDFDGDGEPDILLQSRSSSRPSAIVFGRKDGVPNRVNNLTTVEGRDVHSGVSRITVRDVNGDGRDDLVLTPDIGKCASNDCFVSEWRSV